MIKNIYRSGQKPERREINGAAIPVGETFTGKIANYTDWLFLRTHTAIVSLNDPDRMWTGALYPDVRDFEPVDISIDIIGPALPPKAAGGEK